jgi:hypothetical protein
MVLKGPRRHGAPGSVKKIAQKDLRPRDLALKT